MLLIHEWSFAAGRNFQLSMKLFLEEDQPQYRTIVTNHFNNATGFTIEMDAPGKAHLHLGTASGLVVSDLFDLALNTAHQIELIAAASGVRLAVDDHVVYQGSNAVLASTSSLSTENYYILGRNVADKIKEFYLRINE